MANVNTVADALREAGFPNDTPITLTNPGGNNPTLFTFPATFTANAGAPVVLQVPSTAANGIDIGSLAGVPNALPVNPWYADGNMFLVRAVGRVQPNAAGKTLKLYLYAGNGLSQSASAGALQDFEIGLINVTLPATVGTGVFSNWFVECKCLWDSASLQLTGLLSGQIAGTSVAAVGFSVYNPSAWLAQQAAGAYNNLPFVLGANLNSTANANNDLVILDEFSAEMI